VTPELAIADMSSATSSVSSDKCYPCLLDDGQYITRTGQLALSAHRPLLSLLQEVCRNIGHSRNGQPLIFPLSQLFFLYIILPLSTSVLHGGGH